MSAPPSGSPRGDRRPSDLPAHIGKYRVLARLGEGATSEVFLARDDFREHRRRDQARARRRCRPTRATPLPAAASSPPKRRWSAAFSTPNVVQIFDAVADDAAALPGDGVRATA
jgi:hypothetical protein